MKNIVNLGNVATYINGYAFKPSDWAEDGTPIIRIQDLTGNSYQMNRFKGKVDSKYNVISGDVLISWSASLGVYVWNRGDAVLNQHIFKVVFDKMEVDKDFFVFQVDNLLKRAANQAHGATMRHLTKPVFDALPFYLPDIKTQRLISSKLNLIGHLIEDHHNQLKKLDELIRSRFLELFGDPLAGNAKWPIHNLCMVADAIDPQPSHRTPPIDKNGIPYISIKDCDYNTGKIDFEKARKVNVKVLQEHKTRYQIHNGDMMIGKIGTIGYPVFLPTYETYTLSANVILIQPNKSKVQPCFLKYSLESPYVESQFDKAKHSTSQSAFGILKIRKIKVMNPELSIQNQFADFVNQVDKSKYRGTISLHLLEDVSHML